MLRYLLPAAAALTFASMTAIAAPEASSAAMKTQHCRDSHGKFVACAAKPCRDAYGKFVACRK